MFNKENKVKNIILSLLFLTISYPIGANAGFVTGHALVESSKEWKTGEYGYKIAEYQYYILGVVDSLDDSLICTPFNVEGVQLFSIVYKYINMNPEKWNNSAFSLVSTPLLEAFPCNKK